MSVLAGKQQLLKDNTGQCGHYAGNIIFVVKSNQDYKSDMGPEVTHLERGAPHTVDTGLKRVRILRNTHKMQFVAVSF